MSNMSMQALNEQIERRRRWRQNAAEMQSMQAIVDAYWDLARRQEKERQVLIKQQQPIRQQLNQQIIDRAWSRQFFDIAFLAYEENLWQVDNEELEEEVRRWQSL